MINRLKEHWKGLLVILGCFVAIQCAPGMLINIIAVILITFFVGIPIYEIFLENRLKNHVKRYLCNLGYEVNSIKTWSSHYGVNFTANGRKYYLKFVHGPVFGAIVEWVDGKPEEIVKKQS